MAEFIGLFGRVADVLVTLSDGKQGYGMAASCQPLVDSCLIFS